MSAEIVKIRIADQEVEFPKECAEICPVLQEMINGPEALIPPVRQLGAAACEKECSGPILTNTARKHFAVCDITKEEYET